MGSGSAWGVLFIVSGTNDRILVCDELSVNPLQNDFFSQKRVPAVRVVLEV